MMEAEPLEVISAFVDGQRVDPAALGAALSLAEGREFLIEAVQLRDLVAVDAIAPPLTPPGPRIVARWPAIAALVLAGVASGFLFGRELAPVPRPPAAVDEPAPPPSRVIELDPGASWTGASGGR
jgi:hypothetical protein